MMDPGKLKHRVELLSESTTVNPNTGERTKEWSAYAKAWAHFQPASGKEFIAAQAVQSEVSARVQMRFRRDVTPKHRLRHRGQTYSIEAVLPDLDSGQEYITLMCSEVGSAER